MVYSHNQCKGANRLPLLTAPTLQAMLLVDWLNRSLNVPVFLLDVTKATPEILDDYALILLDAMLLDAGERQNALRALPLFNPSSQPQIVLFNVHSYEDVLQWRQAPSILAAFPISMHQQALLQQLQTLLPQWFPCGVSDDGSTWLPLSQQTSYLPLTLRELEVMKAMQQGASNQDISQMLYISENTVRTHIYNIFKKIAVKNRTQAVKWADAYLAQNADVAPERA
ncbi:LuxR C-terminal-related transcriptional regulator [Edwardsiella tarda]|uniref:LuxR C-terminal-related transcriptional regulator n=1 Tax=Edwardsiella tarda TaxID=636 RepID=UPI0002FDF312|nr:LuxR C-terminal-related transcriptional regulator [Edwardsiella tarda]